jgi:hypothetical protein
MLAEGGTYVPNHFQEAHLMSVSVTNVHLDGVINGVGY